MRARDRQKGSDRDTDNKTLTDQEKTLFTDDNTLFLNMRNQTVIIDNKDSGYVVLPSVSECKSLTFDIKVKNTGNAIVLTDYPNGSYSDSVSWGGDYILDTADDEISLRSDGKSWTVVENSIA